MPITKIRCWAVVTAACLAASGHVTADPSSVPTNPSTATNTSPTPTSSAAILQPETAPIIILHIGAHKIVMIPRDLGDNTVINEKAIENSPTADNLTHLITSSVAGAAQAPSGEFHVRGSHGQYTYYLDGAPLPQSVSGSFANLIDPKDIETLQVYTGGFPAKYGDDLAAVFDVTAKAGNGKPAGDIQQTVTQNSTYETNGQYGGSINRLSYFVSAIHGSTNRQLDPQTEDPLHDAGNDSVVFGKFDYQLASGARLILDTAHNDDYFQIPNPSDRAALAQNDTQKENGDIANLILREDQGDSHLIVAAYSHSSQLRYFPSAVDLVQDDPANPQPLATATENQTANYYGLRTDYTDVVATRHELGAGFDVDTLVGHENFLYITSTPNANNVIVNQTFTEDEPISGGDRAAYLQDNWTPGRWMVNYGARYDIHKADTTTSQLSPRLNFTYTTDSRDKFHAYYDRLFQPVAIEDVRDIDPTATEFKPERDNLYEVGWTHDNGKLSTGLTTYYKTEKDVVDENILAGTTIPEPFNVAEGYVRGIEFTMDGPVTTTVSFYFNFARSWAESAGAITGGFNTPQDVLGWFYDDHDQTNTISSGATYTYKSEFVDIDSEYGSGFPYGQINYTSGPDAGQAEYVNYVRLPPHLIFNISLGRSFGSRQIAFTCDNILNHAYIVKQAGPFTDTEWGEGRTLGIKLTQNF